MTVAVGSHIFCGLQVFPSGETASVSMSEQADRLHHFIR